MNLYNIIILTGLSGSGKSTAITALEDSGYYCVDNLPIELLLKFLELPIKSVSIISGLAFVMDLRDSSFLSQHAAVFDSLHEKGYNFELIFLEADDSVLLRRFSQTRRPHPVTSNDQLIDNIREERKQLVDLRKAAHRIIDTSSYNLHDLKFEMTGIVKSSHTDDGLRLSVMSFGYKYGIPSGADLVVDVRFLQNPYFVKELKPLSGLDDGVSSFVLKNEPARIFVEKYISLLDFLIPQYQREGKSYLTIAVGCTGGRHRSVAVAAEITGYLKSVYKNNLSITHRDIDL